MVYVESAVGQTANMTTPRRTKGSTLERTDQVASCGEGARQGHQQVWLVLAFHSQHSALRVALIVDLHMQCALLINGLGSGLGGRGHVQTDAMLYGAGSKGQSKGHGHLIEAEGTTGHPTARSQGVESACTTVNCEWLLFNSF
eukprot:1133972-Pelagomonas_calceolata.AAC.2